MGPMTFGIDAAPERPEAPAVGPLPAIPPDGEGPATPEIDEGEHAPTGDGRGAWRGCPFVLVPEGEWRAAQPIREHRCTAARPPAPLTQEKQRRLCLEPAFTACPAYSEALRRRDEVLASAGLAGAPPRRPFVRTVPVIVEGPAPRRWSGGALGGLQRSSQLGLVLVIVVAAIALALARLPGQRPAGLTVGSPTTAPSVTATLAPASAPPSATPPPTVAPSTTAPPTVALATPLSTTPAPSSVVATGTYRVKRGDTLFVIAQRFHTTVRVLQQLNGIVDPSYIQVGQVLKVP